MLNITPRTGNLEVSFEGKLIFSKLKAGVWPNPKAIGNMCAQIAEAIDKGKNIKLLLASAVSNKMNKPKKGEKPPEKIDDGGFVTSKLEMKWNKDGIYNFEQKERKKSPGRVVLFDLEEEEEKFR